MTTTRFATLFLLSAVACGVLGCGDEGVKRPELGLVNGSVTLDGKPLSGVAIGFQPVHGGHAATATVDDEGNYELVYDDKVMGATVGPNIVSIVYPTGETGPKVPQKYSVRASASEKVKVTVEPGKNAFDFALESDEPGSNAQEPVVD